MGDQHKRRSSILLRFVLVSAFLPGLSWLFRPLQAYADTGAFIVEGDIWTYFKGREEPPADWNTLNFDDSSWLSGPTGIGYGDGDDATILADMRGEYTSVYMRHAFTVTELAFLDQLALRISYDDGFVAYLNGTEVARRNLGASGTTVHYTATATEGHEARGFETVDISEHLSDLIVGTNVLAIQVHNRGLWNADLSMIPELHWVDDPGGLSDTLLLYDARNESASDSNYRRISEYYGLKWARVDLSANALRRAHLKDEAGEYYRAIGISQSALALLDPSELALLEEAVDARGSNLLITDLSESNSSAVASLTNGEIIGSRKPSDSSEDFIISDQLPQVSREFSGQSLTGVSLDAQADYALELAIDHSHVEPIISSTDDFLRSYHIFARYSAGVGNVFVQGRNKRYMLDDWPSYYSMDALYVPQHLTEIVPLMMFFRYAIGDEAWHHDRDYANFTIDDAPLVCDSGEEPCHWQTLYWNELLPEMQAHNFHTTIAFIPKNYQRSDPKVVNQFLNNPDYYSLVFHGNNHDSGLPYPDDCPEFTPDIPRWQKEKDLLEAKQRMLQHEVATGIPYGMVMVFPCQLSGLEALDLLKKYNFNATVNRGSRPIGAEYSTPWDRGMYPAYMEYSNFATVTRYNLREQEYIKSYTHIFDLFRDKPALVYEHAQSRYNFFGDGMDAFNPSADGINGLEGEVEWKSLDYIIKRLYLEKRNDDGSIAVKMYGNNLVLENQSGRSQAYHIKREENFSYPFRVLVDGQDTPYSTTGQELMVDLTIPSYSTREILIIYDPEVRTTQSYGTTEVSEEGATDKYKLSLPWPPTADVTVTINHGNQLTVSPASVTFRPDNWALPQAVTVSAVDDAVAEPSPHSGLITHNASSADSFYDSLPIDSVTVSITDNDTTPEPFYIYLPIVLGD